MANMSDVGNFVKNAYKTSWDHVARPTGRYLGGLIDTYHKDQNRFYDVATRETHYFNGMNSDANAGRETRRLLNKTVVPPVKWYGKNWRYTLPATAGLAVGYLIGSAAVNVGNAPEWVKPALTLATGGTAAISGGKYLNREFHGN